MHLIFTESSRNEDVSCFIRDRISRLKRAGYTLVEVTICLAVLTLLLGLGGGLLARGRANRQLDASARELEAALKQARSAATSREGAVVRLSPTGDGHTFRVEAGGEVLSQGAIPRGILVSLPSALDPVQFNGNGSAKAGGVLRLTSQHTGRSASLAISERTGAVALAHDSP